MGAISAARPPAAAGCRDRRIIGAATGAMIAKEAGRRNGGY